MAKELIAKELIAKELGDKAATAVTAAGQAG
jgi:hypothetical protein